MESIFVTNTIHPIYLAKVLYKQLLDRDHRSAIMVTGSIAAFWPSPNKLMYTSTKSFANYFASAMGYENTEKIDVLSYNPALTKTNLMKASAGGFIVTPTESVKCAIRDIGKEVISYGCGRHEFLVWLCTLWPGS